MLCKQIRRVSFQTRSMGLSSGLYGGRSGPCGQLALSGLDRAGVIAIAPTLAGPERHGPAAVGAEADARKESGTTDHAGRRYLRVAGTQMRPGPRVGRYHLVGGIRQKRRASA
jgi:hypothetical protein